jgi:hypothetical protein
MSTEPKVGLEIPEEVKVLMYQTWLPAVMTSVLEIVKKLPEEQKSAVYTALCKTCGELAMAGALGPQPGMSWDQYAEFLEGTTPPIGPWKVKCAGKVYDLFYEASVDENGNAVCHCPLIHLEIGDPLKQCCDSGAELTGCMIGAVTGLEIDKFEVVKSPIRTCDSCCHYRVTVK